MNLKDFIQKVSDNEIIFNNIIYVVEYNYNDVLREIIKDNKKLKIKKVELISALYNF